MIPLVSAIAVLNHVSGEVASQPDSGVFIGIAHNLRVHRSLTSPADPGWLLASPAQTAARRGFIPIPDFAPAYPVIGAATSDPVTAFTVIGLFSVFLLLAAAGGLAKIAAGSTVAGVALQAVLVVGPLSKFPLLPRITLLDLASVIQADLLALSFLLAALCGFLVYRASSQYRWLLAGAALSVASGMTRYAYFGAVVGLAVIFVAQWNHSRNETNRSCAIASSSALIVTPAWILGYQWFTGSGAAKQFHVHLRDVSLIGRIVGGWFGISAENRVLDSAVLVALIVCVTFLAVRKSSVWLRVCSGAILGYLFVHILTYEFLDQSYAFAAERTLLPVRVLLFVLLAGGAVGLIRARRDSSRKVASLIALAVFGIVAVGGASVFAAPISPGITSRTRNQINPERLPVLSYLADLTYGQLRQPVSRLPSAIEDSTGRVLDIRRQASELVAVLRRQGTKYLVLFPPSLPVARITPDQWPSCTQTKPLNTVAGIQRYELEIGAC